MSIFDSIPTTVKLRPWNDPFIKAPTKPYKYLIHALNPSFKGHKQTYILLKCLVTEVGLGVV